MILGSLWGVTSWPKGKRQRVVGGFNAEPCVSVWTFILTLKRADWLSQLTICLNARTVGAKWIRLPCYLDSWWDCLVQQLYLNFHKWHFTMYKTERPLFCLHTLHIIERTGTVCCGEMNSISCTSLVLFFIQLHCDGTLCSRNSAQCFQIRFFRFSNQTLALNLRYIKRYFLFPHRAACWGVMFIDG